MEKIKPRLPQALARIGTLYMTMYHSSSATRCTTTTNLKAWILVGGGTWDWVWGNGTNYDKEGRFVREMRYERPSTETPICLHVLLYYTIWFLFLTGTLIVQRPVFLRDLGVAKAETPHYLPPTMMKTMTTPPLVAGELLFLTNISGSSRRSEWVMPWPQTQLKFISVLV